MTPTQANRSFRLAQSFGHGWAVAILHSLVPSGSADFRAACERALVDGTAARAVIAHRLDLDYAVKADEAAHEDYDGGLRADSKHTTQSGTLSWDVATDGTVTILVRAYHRDGYGVGAFARDASVIASVTVAADGSTTWNHHRTSTGGNPDLRGSDAYGYRVASQAVEAVGGRVEAQPAPRRLPRGRGLASIA